MPALFRQRADELFDKYPDDPTALQKALCQLCLEHLRLTTDDDIEAFHEVMDILGFYSDATDSVPIVH